MSTGKHDLDVQKKKKPQQNQNQTDPPHQRTEKTLSNSFTTRSVIGQYFHLSVSGDSEHVFL